MKKVFAFTPAVFLLCLLLTGCAVPETVSMTQDEYALYFPKGTDGFYTFRVSVDSEPEIKTYIARPDDLLAGENAEELQAYKQMLLDFYLDVYPEGFEKLEDPSTELISLTAVRVEKK